MDDRSYAQVDWSFWQACSQAVLPLALFAEPIEREGFTLKPR